MNYKKIIKSRDLRLKILKILSFIPDSIMLRLQYYIQLNRMLNLSKPQRYTEKIQLYKLNYKNNLMIQCVDKYDVRDYVKKCGLEKILNECYGVYDNAEEVDFDKLPDSFVCKDTLGGGGTSVVIINDKTKYDLDKLKNIMKGWTNLAIGIPEGGREWPYYSGKKHRIIIERLIESEEKNKGLVDYKFICFNGKVEYILVLGNRAFGKKVDGAFFDRNYNLLEVKRRDLGFLTSNRIKPRNYEMMLKYAEQIAKPFPHARIDFYNVNGKIFFGEITFYDGSGYMQFDPDEFDYELGNLFNIES